MTYSPTDTTTTSGGGGSMAGSDELKPITVKTVKVKAANISSSPIGTASAQSAAKQPAPPSAARAPAEESITVTAGATPVSETMPAAPPQTLGAQARALQHTASVMPAQASIPKPTVASTGAAIRGWMIQVGALETQKDADERIAAARSKATSLLAKAKAFTESIVKSDMKLYRARFANISKDEAESACKALKSAKIVCIAMKN
jgi:D-alanyl-D-alanine carboxypeptidase